MFYETKAALSSKTIWGAVVALAGAIAPVILPMVGIQPGEWAQITSAAGAILAIYGRLTAKKAIG